MILHLTLASLKNRALTSVLTILSIGLSVALFVGAERLRISARESFQGTVSGAHLLVGARGGSVQLLLYSIFHIGNASNNVSYKSYEELRKDPRFEWTIPISLGDSHRGFRVVGTTESFLKNYRYRDGRALELREGKPGTDLFDVVIGADVADKLKYTVGKDVVISHGISAQAIQRHEDKPFRVAGILKKTGTPIDRSLYISLEGMEALHIDWQSGAAPTAEEEIPAERVRKMKLKVGTITAFLVRMKSPQLLLRTQRTINEYPAEPLTAIIPGTALQELWTAVSYAEDALRIVTYFIVLVGLSGMFLSIYTTLNERRREMSILRSLGARAHHIVFLLLTEAAVLSALGTALGLAMVYGLLFAFQPLIEARFGIFIPVAAMSLREWLYLFAVFGCGLLTGAVPAIRAYRNALIDGLSMRT
jgi:putative ABC transport system permease protein